MWKAVAHQEETRGRAGRQAGRWLVGFWATQRCEGPLLSKIPYCHANSPKEDPLFLQLFLRIIKRIFHVSARSIFDIMHVVEHKGQTVPHKPHFLCKGTLHPCRKRCQDVSRGPMRLDTFCIVYRARKRWAAPSVPGSQPLTLSVLRTIPLLACFERALKQIHPHGGKITIARGCFWPTSLCSAPLTPPQFLQDLGSAQAPLDVSPFSFLAIKKCPSPGRLGGDAQGGEGPPSAYAQRHSGFF